MSAFLIYMIRSACCLLLFYVGYKALLSKETFFGFNRKVLLGGLFVCLLLPLAEFKTDHPSVIQMPFVELDIMLTDDIPAFIPLTDSTEAVSGTPDQEVSNYTPGKILGWIYIAGIIVAALASFRSFGSLVLFLRKGTKIKKAGYTLVLTPKPVMPFNWGRYIVMSESDYLYSDGEVLMHEQAHLMKRHSSDLFLIELVAILQWFNPVVWMLRRELKNVHEYEADMHVINNGIDATKYQLLLLKKAISSRSYAFANSFNQSKLKTRITMMLKKQSNRQARWKLALLVPMVAFAVYAFAQPDVNRQLQQLIPGEDTTIPKDVKTFNCESFNGAFDAYYKQRYGESSFSRYEKLDRLKDVSRMIRLLINVDDRYLISNDETSLVMGMDEFEMKIDSFVSHVQGRDKPILIALQYDRGTSPKCLELTFSTLGKVVERYKTESSPVLIGCIEPKHYPAGSRNNAQIGYGVNVKAVDKHGKEFNIDLSEYDTYAVLKKKLDVLKSKSVVLVEIKADPKTPMAVITDIKSVIREMQESASGSTPGYKVETRL